MRLITGGILPSHSEQEKGPRVPDHGKCTHPVVFRQVPRDISFAITLDEYTFDVRHVGSRIRFGIATGASFALRGPNSSRPSTASNNNGV